MLLDYGFCTICEKETTFVQHGDWLRDQYTCKYCNSIPRQRAIINALNTHFPNWPALLIHESSPVGASSEFIKKRCKNYTSSHYFTDIACGEYKLGMRCENLERMTFRSDSFDLFLTQDVFEHVLNPERAFNEISRVLKAGGAHVFTMPWYPMKRQTVIRACEEGGEVKHLLDPIYHLSPISQVGSLVTRDWGRDFTDIIFSSSGMSTTVYLVKDRKFGLDGEFLDVFISKKPEMVEA